MIIKLWKKLFPAPKLEYIKLKSIHVKINGEWVEFKRVDK